jgi:hypothetical protein
MAVDGVAATLIAAAAAQIVHPRRPPFVIVP